MYFYYLLWGNTWNSRLMSKIFSQWLNNKWILLPRIFALTMAWWYCQQMQKLHQIVMKRLNPCLYNHLLGQGGYVFGSVGLFVCLSVSNIAQKVINGLWWNGKVWGGQRKNWSNFGCNLGLLRWENEKQIVVACPDWGTGNDPEALGLASHEGPTFIVNLP